MLQYPSLQLPTITQDRQQFAVYHLDVAHGTRLVTAIFAFRASFTECSHFLCRKADTIKLRSVCDVKLETGDTG